MNIGIQFYESMKRFVWSCGVVTTFQWFRSLLCIQMYFPFLVICHRYFSHISARVELIKQFFSIDDLCLKHKSVEIVTYYFYRCVCTEKQNCA